MNKMSEKERQLLTILKSMSCENDEIPNERENLIICIMLEARENNRVDELISIADGHKLHSFADLIFKNAHVEIVDDE